MPLGPGLMWPVSPEEYAFMRQPVGVSCVCAIHEEGWPVLFSICTGASSLGLCGCGEGEQKPKGG